MITLIIGAIQNADVLKIIGYITAGLEVLLVVIRFLQYLVEPDSNFGKFLSKLLKGVKFLKSTTSDALKEGEENGREDEPIE